MKWLAIMNPAAHNGAGRNQLRSLARFFRKELDAPCAWTTCTQHARDIARSSQEFDGLIAVGGDGTICEVINGMDLQSQCLGIVPAGTGNGLARELRMENINSALRYLRRPRLAPLDLIQVRFRTREGWQQRYSVHISALGYFADLDALGIGPLKRLGYLRYAAAAFILCFRQKPFLVRMKIDDSAEQELLLTELAVNNTRYAGQFCLFPKARLQDGRLDLLYGKHDPRHQLLEDLGILTQTYVAVRSRRCQAQTVCLELAQPMTLMLDGELIPKVEAVRFQVVRGKLRCVAGKESGLKLLDAEQAPSPASAQPATGRQPARC